MTMVSSKNLSPAKRARRAAMQAARRKQKLTEAQARTVERATRTPAQQLSRLDMLFGAGQGARRERARLAAQVAGDEKKSRP